MSLLYIIRHGQASFFADDYDRLSEKGHEQARVLGSYLRENGFEINEVYSGSLKRQIQTAESCGETYCADGKHWPETQILEGLNEYGADEVMSKLKNELIQKHEHVRKLDDDYTNSKNDSERYRTFHRLLEALMQYYIADDYESTGFETWRQFHDRVTQAYKTIQTKEGNGRKIAVFTSGGPIGVSVQACLNAPEQQAGELNWRVYNASITQFTFRADRISLDQFNSISHLPKEMRSFR